MKALFISLIATLTLSCSYAQTAKPKTGKKTNSAGQTSKPKMDKKQATELLVAETNKESAEINWNNVKRAILAGADVNALNNLDETALMVASYNGKLEIVKLLLARSADVHAKDMGRETALMDAASSGSVEIVKLLLEKGADVNAKDQNGETALTLTESEEIKKLLISKGAK